MQQSWTLLLLPPAVSEVYREVRHSWRRAERCRSREHDPVQIPGQPRDEGDPPPALPALPVQLRACVKIMCCALRERCARCLWGLPLDVGARTAEGMLRTLRVAVFPPVFGPVMMTLRSSGRTQISIGTGGRFLSRSSDSLSLPPASESACIPDGNWVTDTDAVVLSANSINPSADIVPPRPSFRSGC